MLLWATQAPACHLTVSSGSSFDLQASKVTTRSTVCTGRDLLARLPVARDTRCPDRQSSTVRGQRVGSLSRSTVPQDSVAIKGHSTDFAMVLQISGTRSCHPIRHMQFDAEVTWRKQPTTATCVIFLGDAILVISETTATQDSATRPGLSTVGYEHRDKEGASRFATDKVISKYCCHLDRGRIPVAPYTSELVHHVPDVSRR